MKKRKYRFPFGLCTLLFLLSNVLCSQDPYFQRQSYFETYDYSLRTAPEIPPKGERMRVIIDTDTKAEVDDLWALSLALLSPERFEIIGIIGATFITGGPESVEMSCREIDTILALAGMSGQIPVLRGSQPMAYPYAPSESEGVDFIIEKAMESSPDDPLWIIGLGAPTDMASALLKQPEIADRVKAFWHLRTAWPEKASNFNVFGDIHAARLLFHSPLQFVLFDTGTHLSCPMKESEERVRSQGPLGKYLHDYRLGKAGTYGTEALHSRLVRGMTDDRKGFFDLGDIAALLDPDIASFEIVDCPDVGHDVSYHFNGTKGKILRCYDIDRDKTFDLLYNALESQVPRIIFDTDFGGDSDDLGSLAMLHNLKNQGDCKLLAIMCWNTEKYAVSGIDAVNRYYGNPEIPIGVRKEGSQVLDWNYGKSIADKLPHRLTGELVEDAITLYRKTLVNAEDSSIVLLTVGPLKNIQNLIKSPPDSISSYSGAELITRKVKEMVIMGGKFPEGDGEWNFNGNMPGVTKFVLEHITVPITFSGFEVGFQIKTGELINELDTLSPLYLGYQRWSARLPRYKGEVLDNESYDQTAVLYAVKGGIDTYWSRVEGGYCEADEHEGKNKWIQSEHSNHSYLKLMEDPEIIAEIIESIMLNTF